MHFLYYRRNDAFADLKHPRTLLLEGGRVKVPSIKRGFRGVYDTVKCFNHTRTGGLDLY